VNRAKQISRKILDFDERGEISNYTCKKEKITSTTEQE
jgi:hypothetical protein